MVEHFKELGATHAFDYDKADFSGISSTSDSIRLERLYISKIIHKSFVEINEKETKAFAATVSLGIRGKLAVKEEETRVFNCNRNFIFVIHVDKPYSSSHNNNNSILFFGKCARPPENQKTPFFLRFKRVFNAGIIPFNAFFRVFSYFFLRFSSVSQPISNARKV